jgi:hypothetical protein
MDKNHQWAKLSTTVLTQHKIPYQFSIHLQLGFSALHPKYCPLQAMFAETRLVQNSVNILNRVSVQNILTRPSVLEFCCSCLPISITKTVYIL